MQKFENMDIPSDMGKGRISQTQIKHGIIFSDWQMCYQSDMNVQGTASKDYIQIIFCLNDGISWGIMDEKRSITIQKNESCIYAGHGGTEYACYKKDSNFSFKSIKIPIAYFSQLLTDYFDGQEATAYEKKLLDGISKVPVTPIMEQILAETSQFTQYRGGLGYLYLDGKLLELLSIYLGEVLELDMYSVGMKKMGPYYMAGQKMNNTIIEYINGMEVVKVFNKDADSYERFRKDISDYRNYTLAWYRAAWPWMAIYSSLLPCTIILTLPVGAWFVLCGWSALPNLILVLCLSLSIGMPLLKSLGFLPTMPQLNYKISALEQVLDAPELQQTNDRFHGIDDTITYDHVSFAYQTTQPGPDGKPAVVEDEVLHDISFTAKAGQKTALVGESGSGKSTLAKLLIHYYDPQKGSISIGGQKLCDMSLEALNSRISYVAQDQYLFNTSLLENIRLGRLTATDEEVIEAAKKAQCMEFIEKLPQGIHSMAGDAGKMLSGGQRQRISLARAILKDAPIVVLDEATAYADPENEEKMEAAIAELVKGKTLVVIAHKLPAIMNADQICVIDHGKLVAAGKHQDLIRSCPEYQKLWKAAQDSAEWKVHTAKEGA